MKIEITKEYYEKKLNDVKIKAPIETGIEILVYNILDAVFADSNKVAVVDVNTCHKEKEKRFVAGGGVTDIVLTSDDFEFKKNDKGQIYGFVEVKNYNKTLDAHENNDHKIKLTIQECSRYILTNGHEWRYYKNSKSE